MTPSHSSLSSCSVLSPSYPSPARPNVSPNHFHTWSCLSNQLPPGQRAQVIRVGAVRSVVLKFREGVLAGHYILSGPRGETPSILSGTAGKGLEDRTIITMLTNATTSARATI